MTGAKTTIACIVEGHGEVEALPVLLRRIAAEVSPERYTNVPRPYRANWLSLIRPGTLEAIVQTQADLVEGAGGVLVVIDADDDCPAELGPTLLARAQTARPIVRLPSCWPTVSTRRGSSRRPHRWRAAVACQSR